MGRTRMQHGRAAGPGRQQQCVRRSVVKVAMACWTFVMAGCSNHAQLSSDDAFFGRALREMHHVGTLSSGDTSIAYYCAEGLEEQARRIGELVARQLTVVREATGVVYAYRRINVLLRLVDQVEPHAPTMGSESYSGVLNLMLYVERGHTTLPEIFARNWDFPAFYMHEGVEVSLQQLQSDSSAKDARYTRWFREGLSDYAACLAIRVMKADPELSRPGEAPGPIERRHPYSCLRIVGKKLFTWDQWSDEGRPIVYKDGVMNPHPEPSVIDYYSAALGLFLVIENRCGREAIRNIVLEINRRPDRSVDGAALKQMVNRALNLDVEKLVEGFQYPAIDLFMLRLSGKSSKGAGFGKAGLIVHNLLPDGLAARGGIRKGDIVVSLNGEGTLTNFAFEQALYEHMHRKRIRVGIWRNGKGEQHTAEVQLRD